MIRLFQKIHRFTYTEEGVYCKDTGLCLEYFPEVEKVETISPVENINTKVNIKVNTVENIDTRIDTRVCTKISTNQAKIGLGYGLFIPDNTRTSSIKI
jgi:hypothetical protein